MDKIRIVRAVLVRYELDRDEYQGMTDQEIIRSEAGREIGDLFKYRTSQDLDVEVIDDTIEVEPETKQRVDVSIFITPDGHTVRFEL